MASVEEICDEIALIDKSRVVLSGNVAEIRNRFRQNIFKIRTAADSLVVEPSLCSVISREEGYNSFNYRVKFEENTVRSEFLAKLIKNNEIISFEEEIPSMNEIFIQSVK